MDDTHIKFVYTCCSVVSYYTNAKALKVANSWTADNLAGHDLVCNLSTNRAMSEFFVLIDITAPGFISFGVRCDTVRSASGAAIALGPLTQLYASPTLQDWGSGHVIFLDRLPVDCGSSSLLLAWRYTSLNTTNALRANIQFNCTAPTLQLVKCYETTLPQVGNVFPGTDQLGKLDVRCKPSSYLNKWRVTNTVTIIYTCCYVN